MKNTRLLIVIFAAAVLGASYTAPAAAADPKKEIETLEHKCAEATSVDQLMTCYAPGDDVVVYDIGTPREFDGQKAVRADFQNFFDTVKNPKVDSFHCTSSRTATWLWRTACSISPEPTTAASQPT